MDDLLAKMDSETYLNADQAKELGFVDEVMFTDDKIQLVADGGSGLLPQTAIDKIAELVKPAPDLSDTDIDRISNAVVQKLNIQPTKQAENKFVDPFAF
jgi:ATP-dependent Clp protease protease subunit